MPVCQPVSAVVIALVATLFFSPPQEKTAPPVVKKATLPPLPPGVTELTFSSFFISPVGPQGLELTSKIQALNQKRVRIIGYMVRREQPEPGVFLLTARPEIMHEDEAGYSELPTEYVRVLVPYGKNSMVPYSPLPFLLTGTLSVGNREERDGSVSLVRLILDPVPAKKLAPTPARRAIRKK